MIPLNLYLHYLTGADQLTEALFGVIIQFQEKEKGLCGNNRRMNAGICFVKE